MFYGYCPQLLYTNESVHNRWYYQIYQEGGVGGGGGGGGGGGAGLFFSDNTGTLHCNMLS